MTLSHKARRRLSLVLLLVWMPAYVVGAVSILNAFDRLHWAIEAVIYIILGVAWALPFRFVFRGVGREDPDKPPS
ncbi:MAG: DUF2842 domain-containing protein [Pseudomonadota bacterium]